MHTPQKSRLFSSWKNPSNGLLSYILSEKFAPVQQSFYYTSPGFTDDGGYLWLGCGYPPNGGKNAVQVLGIVDFEQDEFRVYHDTQLLTSRPFINKQTGEAYWGNDRDLWKRGPEREATAELVNSIPEDIVPGTLYRFSTHPVLSADGRSLNIDAHFRMKDGKIVTCIGDMPLDGSPFNCWQKLEGTYNHGLFSPTDPDTQLISHEYWQDNEPFDPLHLYHRMWLIKRGEQARPVLKEPVSHSGHEWWDAEGKHVWYIHYGVGIKKVDVATGNETLIWEGNFSHAHSDASGRYLVADKMKDPVVSECNVIFCDTQTGKTTEIVKHPALPPHVTQCTHLHPHPHFCCNDRYVCYTTIVHGRVDTALVPVDSLI